MKRPMQSDLKLSLLCYVILLLIMSSGLVGCAQPGQANGVSTLSRPFIGDYWIDPVTAQKIEIIDASLIHEWTFTFKYPIPPVGDAVCNVNVRFYGDVKSGTITVSNPDLFQITPSNLDATPCQWIRTMTAYQIVGETLTIYYGSSQARTFKWFGVR